MRKPVFVGLAVAGAVWASITMSVPAAAGGYCGSGYYGYSAPARSYGYYAPTTDSVDFGYYGYAAPTRYSGYYPRTTDSFWTYRRYNRPVLYFGASFYGPPVRGWRSCGRQWGWGGRAWGWRSGWGRRW